MSYKSLAADRGVKTEEEGKKIGPPMPCTCCGAITAHETLRNLGARCVPCFRAYCERVPQAPDTGNKATGPKAWAWALKHREQMGERLTRIQRSAWREALRAELDREAA